MSTTTATVSPTATVFASPAPVFTIALLAFDGMEALDFAGPFEVFTTASRVFAKLNDSETVANKSITTSARMLFCLKSVARTPHAVQARAGLRVLPDADFASPLQADLQRQFPALRVQSGVRWVEAEEGTDGGRITTSAGISAGIDMSLHLVATMADNHMRALGLDGQALAERTAHQMEYTWTQPVPPPQTC